MKLYTEAMDAYMRDDCENALRLLEESTSPLAPALMSELRYKLAHLSGPEAYYDKYEWVGQQIPIMRLTWEVARISTRYLIISHLNDL